jgi:TPR repeat protein
MLFASKKDIKTFIYHIVGDEILSRPGEVIIEGNEVVIPVEEHEDDPSAMNDKGVAMRDPAYPACDYTEARWWFEKAAKSGFAEAQYNLAELYTESFYRFRLYDEGFFWAKQAADQGFTKAYKLLSQLYRDGLGVAKDEAMAALWLAKADTAES